MYTGFYSRFCLICLIFFSFHSTFYIGMVMLNTKLVWWLTWLNWIWKVFMGSEDRMSHRKLCATNRDQWLLSYKVLLRWHGVLAMTSLILYQHLKGRRFISLYLDDPFEWHPQMAHGITENHWNLEENITSCFGIFFIHVFYPLVFISNDFTLNSFFHRRSLYSFLLDFQCSEAPPDVWYR